MAWGTAVSSQLAGTSSATSFPIPIPSGLKAGMLVSAKLFWNNATITLSGPDVSWTQAAATNVTTAGTSQTCAVWWHIATSADEAAAGSGTWTFTTSTSASLSARVDARAGANAAAPVDGTATALGSASSSGLSLTLTGADWVEYVCQTNSTSIFPTAPAGYTDLGSVEPSASHYTNDMATLDYSGAQSIGPIKYASSPTASNGTILVAWSPAASSSNTAAIGSALGALACVATMGAALAASVAGSVGPSATAATAAGTDAASVTAAVGALATATVETASQTVAASSGLSVASALSLAQLQTLAASADFGPLSSSLTVEAVGGINTAAIDSSLGALSSGMAVATVNAAVVTATLGALDAAGATTAQASMVASGALALQSGVRITINGTAALASAIGPLSTAATVQVAAASLPVDDRYYVAAPYRPFYAAPAARSFYLMANPNTTQRFDTKDPRETVVLTFDASADLGAGETLTGTPTVQVTNAYGVDPSAADVVKDAQINAAPITANGVTIALGHAVQAIASAGLNQCGYLAAITCTTSNPDKVLTLKGILPVSSS